VIPPWHLWGSLQTIAIPGATPSQPTTQLAKIEYHRPDTWSFFFWANLPQLISNPTIDVRFDLTFGVGRSVVKVPGFALLRAAFGTPAWTTGVPSTGVVDPITAAITSQLLDRIPAQDIQCQATVLNSPPTGTPAIELGAFFSPFHHSRPDWFAGIMGEELKGK
jgi:hypothetical protein